MYQIHFYKQFSIEFPNFPVDQQNKVLDFIDIFEQHGLTDFSRYEGKITPSWKGMNVSESNYRYARDNSLWHYHVGIPEYRQVHSTYKTSDMVLHFQWPGKGSHVNLLDMYYHYDSEGLFYLPTSLYLKP